VVPDDRTGNFDMMYNFLKENWKIVKWVALGAVIFEVTVKQLCNFLDFSMSFDRIILASKHFFTY
jgi:hypothetical protein